MLSFKLIKRITVLLLIISIGTFGNVLAQDGSDSPQPGLVPDLTGLSAPQAAAKLNRNSLTLGNVYTVIWKADSTTPPDVINIGGQSIPPGQTVEVGTAIDVAIARAPTAQLIYDDNDITLVNLAGVQLDLTNVVFASLDGTASTAFSASRWSPYLRENQCLQLWSVGRNGPKALDACQFIQGWLSTIDPTEHFWTGANGTTQFQVMQNGVSIGICPIVAGQCEIPLQITDAPTDETDYVYFAYTPDRLIVMNNAPTQWMPLGGLIIYNNFVAQPGVPFAIGDPALFGNPSIYGYINRLAPGQCLYFTNGAPFDPNTPQPCDVLARLDLTPSTIFWGAAFDINGVTVETSHTCPAATEGRLIICAMPR